MRTIFLRLGVVVATFVGLLDASFLTFESLSGRVPPCSTTGCETVLTSSWAHIGPVPVAALGVLYYATALGLSILWYFTQRKWSLIGRKISPYRLLFTVLSLGMLFTWFLIWLMANVIGSWCVYCLVSAATTHLAWIMTALQFKKTQMTETSL